MDVTIHKTGKHEFILAFYLHIDFVRFLYFRSFADVDYLVVLDNHCTVPHYFTPIVHRDYGSIGKHNIFHHINPRMVFVVLFNPFVE
jgi:hypothetical protein